MIAFRANTIDLIDRGIKIKKLVSRRRFLDVITDAVDDVSGSIGIVHNAAERLPDLAQVRRLPVQKIQGCTGAVAVRSKGLRCRVTAVHPSW